MSRPVFGVTPSPAQIARERKAYQRTERAKRTDEQFVPSIGRAPDGTPARLYFGRNPDYDPSPIKSTGDSSRRYGPCEICGEHCATVYHRTRDHVFGHRGCLESGARSDGGDG